jgi:hypothetical protein
MNPTRTRAIVEAFQRALTILVGLLLLFAVGMISQNLAGAVVVLPLVVAGKLSYAPDTFVTLFYVVVAASVTGIYGGIPVTRFLIRLFPLQVAGRRRWGCLTSLLVVAVLMTALLAQSVFDPTFKPYLPKPPHWSARLAGLIVVWVQVLMAMRIYGTHHAAVGKPYILYLRRFKTFSDRVVYRFLLSATPAGARLVTLVPKTGGPRDYDPFVIGFSGFRFIHPIRSMPLAFSCRNDAWQERITTLMRGADCIVVDGSASSASMQFEYDKVEELGLAEKTLVLLDEGLGTPATPTVRGATAIVYRRSAWASLPKLSVALALGGLYFWASTVYPVEYPPVAILCLLLVLPSLFQQSLDRASTRAFRDQIARRVRGGRGAGLGPLLGRAVVAGVVVAAIVAAALLVLLPTDPRATATAGAVTMSATVQPLSIGQGTIVVPVPEGFVDPSVLLPSTRRSSEATTPPGRRHLALFVPKGYVSREMLDQHAHLEAYLKLQTPSAFEDESVDPEAFAELKQEFIAAIERSIAETGSNETEAAAQALEKVAPGHGARAALNSMTSLGVFEQRDGSASTTLLADMTTQIDGRSARRRTVIAMTLANVHGKLVQIEVGRDHESAADVEWVQAVTRHWLDRVATLN